MTRFYGGTDIGLVRESNQDRYEYAVLSDNLAFAILCDGMGGYTGGSIASETATNFIAQMLRRDLSEDLNEFSLRSVMDSAVAGANALVHEAAQKDPELASMGTTLVIAVFLHNTLYISYVGDSRAYLLSHNHEHQLTKDHTVVQMLVDLGEISQEDALSHPKRHYITRAIGVGASVEADFVVHSLAPEDLVLLCSDGLYNYLSPGTFHQLASACVQAQSVKQLIDLAKDGGGTDNITVVVAHNQQSSGGNSANG